MKKFFFIGIFVIINFFVSKSQWQQIRQSLDAEITSLVKVNNTLFASTLSKGIFATTDEKTWVAKNTGLTDLKVQDLAESNGKPAAGTDSCQMAKQFH